MKGVTSKGGLVLPFKEIERKYGKTTAGIVLLYCGVLALDKLTDACFKISDFKND